MIERTFQDIPEGKISEADQQSFLIGLGWSRGSTWDDLLHSKRVLIISEAGAGKTYECREHAKHLWNAGEPAFFIELAALATEDLRSQLDQNEETRLDAWLSSQSDVATFFLDSIDELQLSLGSFQLALKRLKKGIGSQLQRARIVITTRPIALDEQLIRSELPIPPVLSSEISEVRFANIAMRDPYGQNENKNEDAAPEWRTVALMPLSDEQIIEFATDQDVLDPDLFLNDLQRRNAQEFVRRPQDLIEQCADWREHKRIRTHRDQVETNVRVKLLPRDDRPEPAELSPDKAMEGASRLALAMQVTRRLTIRHNTASDVVEGSAALDPAIILSDWNPNERKALLERSLFGFASYGRVRFHHRSVTEYLAAERLLKLRERGMPFRTLKLLLFAETKGKTIVRPSKRAVAGWLALKEEGIFELLRDNEPSVLLDEGDPEALTQIQRNQALRAYTDRYGPGGWRGLSIPHIQVHRFASSELACEINRIWRDGVENPDIRNVLISLIEAGRINACSDIAYNLACNGEAPEVERIYAIEALVALKDKRLVKIATDIAAADNLWPNQVARSSVHQLFPNYMSVKQLCQTLGWVMDGNSIIGDLSWKLPRLIAISELDFHTLDRLRDGLVMLVSEGLRWNKERHFITSDRTHLSKALAATCVCGIQESKSDAWFSASVLALRLNHHKSGDNEPIKELREQLSNLKVEDIARLFWTEDRLVQSLRPTSNPWKRFYEITFHNGSVQLKADRDLTWISDALDDTSRNVNERAILLEAAMRLPSDRNALKEHVRGLKSLVNDEPSLVERIDELIKPSELDNELRDLDRYQVLDKKQLERKKHKNHASWIQFWREVANQPKDAFSTEQSWNTAWKLWRAMRHDGEGSRSSGWNRRFIEEMFDKETADRLRSVLMTIWRDDHPTFPSERAEDKRFDFLVRWQLGLAAIYAEAENPDWATKLNDDEAQLAARYATIELNGLPKWMRVLVEAHPIAVDQTLGNELSWELNQAPWEQGHSNLLQRISYAPETVARVFLPRLETWLDVNEDIDENTDNTSGIFNRVRQITSVILEHGESVAITHLLELARQRLNETLPSELLQVWLSVLLRIDPASGVSVLENHIASVDPAKHSEVVTLLANLFGDRQESIGLTDEHFTPQLLLRLLRLAYRHVRIKDDVQHESSYTPDTRDDAERARSEIVTAILNAKGDEGWAGKMEMASDPLCEHFMDRILAVAEENWAQEIDAKAYNETQAVALDKRGEAPASTNEAMFAIMEDRLSDLDELLLRDTSPREAWAGISNEKIMRRELARELGHAGKGIYTVDQEAVTADEKETDIRLRSVTSDYEAVIELKLSDGRSARDLRDTIYDQLVNKYMAAENSSSGCLLVTIAKDRKWQHPDSGKRVDLNGLLSLLREEAKRVEGLMGGAFYLSVHILDLRARLPVEK